MEIVQATEEHVDRYADRFTDLVWETGPASYGYQFDGRELFDLMLHAAWRVPGTLYSYDRTTLALDGDELLGLEVGYVGPEFGPRKKALGGLWGPMLESGEVTMDRLNLLAERAYQCKYLNAVIPSSVYYICALAVEEPLRGKGIGTKLVHHAIERSKQAGLRGLHLDVLSDADAVGFYRGLDMHCLARTEAPIPYQYGVPMEMRMALDYS
jgi:GNAT superfamily N-acetyltransferase